MEAKISALSSIIEAEAPHFPTVQHEAKDDTENPPLSVAVVSWIAEKKTLELTVRRIEDCEA